MKTLSTLIIISVVITAGSVACVPGADCLDGKECNEFGVSGRDKNGKDGDASAENGGPGSAPSCNIVGQAHPGLGGEDLAAKADAPTNGDRLRAKPYSALTSEYARVLGTKNRPALIDSTGGTFGIAAERWYLEPLASAVFINTAYNVAFEGCLKLTGDVTGGTADSKYAAAPTEASAKAECADWTRSFWSREASPEQIDACVTVALESTSETYGRPGVDEATRETSAKRRWAYACASVLTSTGFLMY